MISSCGLKYHKEKLMKNSREKKRRFFRSNKHNRSYIETLPKEWRKIQWRQYRQEVRRLIYHEQYDSIGKPRKDWWVYF